MAKPGPAGFVGSPTSSPRPLCRCVGGWRGKHFFKETLCHYFIYSVKNSKASFLPEEREGASHPPRTPSAVGGEVSGWGRVAGAGGSPLPQLPRMAPLQVPGRHRLAGCWAERLGHRPPSHFMRFLSFPLFRLKQQTKLLTPTV